MFTEKEGAMKLMMIGTMGLIVLGLSACSSTKPVLYPNEHFLSVGKEIAEQDIKACEQLAESAGVSEGGGKAGDIATSTAVGAGMGAASGAVGGAIYGSAGQGSLIGAASGATAGLLRGMMYARPSQPNQAYTSFMHRCLQEKGYEVTGWQ